MRRKANRLVPLEVELLTTLARLGEEYGYPLTQRSAGGTATIYRALRRLERFGLVSTRWEPPEEAAAEERPRRRYYRLTAQGELVLKKETA